MAIKNHPVALPYLFLTEMWERFGFYTVQGLLVLYMTEYFGFSDADSYTILGIFTALVYIAPILGGYLANNIMGYKTAILCGSLFLILGYFLLALPWAKQLLYPALAIIIVGNGLFKPNISSLLGLQYAQEDSRRESGFTIFYIGINLGVLLAGLGSGYVKEYLGWRMCFLFSSIGLVIGLSTFLLGRKTIRQPEKRMTTRVRNQLLIGAVLAVIALTLLLRIQLLATWLLPIVGVTILIFLLTLTWKQDQENRKRMVVLTMLILSSIVFWMIFIQMFLSANLFVERLVDKDYFGFHLPSTVFWGSESIFIILLGPFFAWMWNALAKKAKNPSALVKFALAIFIEGLAFLLLAFCTTLPSNDGLINPCWVFLSYFLLTLGELLLSPIGLSAITMLAPAHLIGLMMGIWFVATGFGGQFAGIIAQRASIPNLAALSNNEKLLIYQNAFFDYAYLAFFVAIILFFVHLIMKKIRKH